MTAIRTDKLDGMTVAMLSAYRRATPAIKRAFFIMIQRVAEKEMPLTDAMERYWVDLGLSEDEARRQVQRALKQSEGSWRRHLD
jgi:hypothetical protein